MDRNTRVAVKDGIVHITVRGEVKLAESGSTIALAAQVAADAGSELLLIDITGAHYREYHALAMEHARRARETGMVKFRIAILGHAGDSKLSYFENVAMNRGIRARSFTTRRDALTWLKESKS